ncbi:hypothetical protein AB0M47_01880 [Hamadaea sp. NPDC051192]|uniref:hypothetical protein n=1 Tax=Hamadaea sp. NPDC051192 TaxID=3154940 RepID=UPI00343DE99D
MTDSAAPPARRTGRWLLAAVGGWAALAAFYYLTLPIFGVLGLLGWLALAGFWILAVVTTVLAMAALIGRKAYARAAVTGILAIVAAVAVWNADWLDIYLKSQLWLHQDSLSKLAGAHQTGTLPTNASLPWQLRYLSIDGHAHHQMGSTTDALYLPMWENWRGEAGGGLVHLTEPPDSDTIIVTAPGGVSGPDRYLGNGWWWVEGG